jgi:hypothetical protein
VQVVLGHADEAERRRLEGVPRRDRRPVREPDPRRRFGIDGVSYQLERNFLGKHSLHSGSAGFHRQEWTVAEADADHVRLTLTWSDTTGEHPGPVHAAVTYGRRATPSRTTSR